MADIITEISPTMADWINRIFEAAKAGEYGPIMAEVETYDDSLQICDATPVVWVPRDGELTRLPTIRCIPVQWPSGLTGSFTTPLTKGALVELVPQMADITKWHNQGSVGVEPDDPRAFQLSDVVAIPGGRSMANPLPPAASAVDGPVVWSTGFVYLGSSLATAFVAKANLVDSNWTALKIWLDVHAHAGPGSPPATPSPTPTAVGSAKVKVE